MAREIISDEERAERERVGRARSSQRKFLEVQRRIILSQVYLEQLAQKEIAESETYSLLTALRGNYISRRPFRRIDSKAVIEGINGFIPPEITGLSSWRRCRFEYYRTSGKYSESSGFRLSQVSPTEESPEDDIFFHLSGYPYSREDVIHSINIRNKEGKREGLMLEELVPNYLDRLKLTQLLANALLPKKAI